MSGTFKNKLLRYEPVPPPGTWDSISNELDGQFVSHDAILSARLETIGITPSHTVWPEIESFLDNERKPAKQAKIVPLLYKRLAIAVMLAAVVAVSVMNLFTQRQQNDHSTELSSLEKSNRDIKTDVSTILRVPSPATEIAIKSLAAAATITSGTRPEIFAQQTAFTVNEEPEPASDINEAYFADLQTVDAEQPVSIPARPIRDAGGNIIMDINLISNPDDSYITVTCPNGSQTKISCKFLNCLSYLNGDISNDDVNYDGIMWKDKFQSWRDKLLNGDSFIPSASNFFDIFEMKDMIEEQ